MLETSCPSLRPSLSLREGRISHATSSPADRIVPHELVSRCQQRTHVHARPSFRTTSHDRRREAFRFRFARSTLVRRQARTSARVPRIVGRPIGRESRRGTTEGIDRMGKRNRREGGRGNPAPSPPPMGEIVSTMPPDRTGSDAPVSGSTFRSLLLPSSGSERSSAREREGTLGGRTGVETKPERVPGNESALARSQARTKERCASFRLALDGRDASVAGRRSSRVGSAPREHPPRNPPYGFPKLRWDTYGSYAKRQAVASFCFVSASKKADVPG